MLKRIAVVAFIVMMAALPAFAQEPKAEVGVIFGWVFSDGTSLTNNIFVPVGCGTPAIGPCVGSFNRIDPKDAFGWGIDVGFFVGPNAEVGFQYTQQATKLEASGTTTFDIGDVGIHTYHGTFAYNWGHPDSPIRPYVMGGLGATSYSDVTATTSTGTHTINGLSRFSTTWGGGVKIYGSGKVGGKIGVLWTPT
jgi:hypothetical protein